MTNAIERRLAKLESAAGRPDDPMNYPARRFIIGPDEIGDDMDILRARGDDGSGPGWIIVRKIVRPLTRRLC